MVGPVLFPPVQPTAAPAAHGGALTRRLPAGQGATAGGRHSIAPGIAVFQPAASLFMDFIGHFSLSLPSAPPLDPTRHDRLPAVAHMHLREQAREVLTTMESQGRD